MLVSNDIISVALALDKAWINTRQQFQMFAYEASLDILITIFFIF